MSDDPILAALARLEAGQNTLRTDIEAMRNEMRNSFVALRWENEALRREMEAQDALKRIIGEIMTMVRALEVRIAKLEQDRS